MKIYFILLLLIIVYSLYKSTISSNININEKLENSIYNEDLSAVLNNFNTKLIRKDISSIDKHVSYTTGTFDSKIKHQVLPVINNLLDDINLNSNQRIKLTDITRIEHLTDKENNQQFLIQLFVLRVNIHASSKIILNYYVSNTGKVNINSIKMEKDTFTKSAGLSNLNNTFTPNAAKYHNYKKTGQLNIKKDHILYGALHSDMNNESKKSNNNKLQEPCKYNLHMWNSSGVNKIYKPHKKCNINNNSEQKPSLSLYTNPTLFSPSFVNPDKYL